MDLELISSSGITAQAVHDEGGKVTPEIQDCLEITPIREYPLYAGGRLLVGQVTKRTGMHAGTDPAYCRIDIPDRVGTYPREWFPITEIRSTFKLIDMLEKQHTGHGVFVPKEILLDCYRYAWERLHRETRATGV